VLSTVVTSVLDDVSLHGVEPFCYVPLGKSADGRISYDATISGNGALSSLSGVYDISQEMFGWASCRKFRHEMGKHAGTHVTLQINHVLRGR